MTDDSQENQKLADINAEAIDGALKNVKIPTAKRIIELTNSGKEIEFLVKLAGDMAPGISPLMFKSIRDSMKNKQGTFAKGGKLAEKSPRKKLYDDLGREMDTRDQSDRKPQNEADKEQPSQETGEQGNENQGGDGNKTEEEKNNARKEAEKNDGTPKEKGETPQKIKKDVRPANPSDKYKNLEKLAKGARSTGIQTAGNAVGGAIGTGVKAIAALPPVRIALIIIAAIAATIAVIGIIVVVSMTLWHSGKTPPETANAAGDYGQIQANSVNSRIDTLKKALEENVDDFIKQIEDIKNSSKRNKKEGEITKLADEIIKDANELKNLPAVDPANPSANGTTAGKKEELKAKIMDKVEVLIKLITSDSSALAQELLKRIQEGKATCYPHACKDLQDQAQSGHAYNSSGNQVVLNPAMLNTLLTLIDQYNFNFEISTFTSGHNQYVADSDPPRESRHYSGNAVDIFNIKGSGGNNLSVFSGNNSTNLSVRIDLKMADILKQISNASQIIYNNDPRSGSYGILSNGGKYMTASGHTDHIHLGY